MATKDQYEFYQRLYDDEEKTAARLEARAKVFLGIISAFLVTILLKTTDAKTSADLLHLPWLAVLAEAAILSAALVCVILALRVRVYEVVADGVSLLVGYGDTLPPDEDFYESMIVEYAVASSRNRVINQQTSVLLAFAGWLITVGLLFIFALTLVALRRPA